MNVAKNASIEFLSNMLLLFVEFPRLAVCQSQMIIEIVGMCFVCQGLKCFPEICVTASTCAIMCMKQIKKLYLSVYLESSILLLNCSALCFICSIWEASSCPASWVILVIAYRLSKHMSLTTNLSHSNCFQCFHFLIQFCSRFLLIDLQFAYLVPP